MMKRFIALAFTLAASNSFSQSAPPSHPPAEPSNHALIFAVVQDEFVLDNSTIKNASMIEKDRGIYAGLHIELKPAAAALFADITKAGVGRKLNLIFNKVIVTTAVIQTPLEGNFLITGISKEDAQAFLNVLNANKPKTEDGE